MVDPMPANQRLRGTLIAGPWSRSTLAVKTLFALHRPAWPHEVIVFGLQEESAMSPLTYVAVGEWSNKVSTDVGRGLEPDGAPLGLF
jgi:hypothetical protein